MKSEARASAATGIRPAKAGRPKTGEEAPSNPFIVGRQTGMRHPPGL
jgi:hypothetical protein